MYFQKVCNTLYTHRVYAHAHSTAQRIVLLKSFGYSDRMVKKSILKLWLALWLLAASRGTSALPWKVVFGGCVFSGDNDGAPLVRSGSCPSESGKLDLAGRGITSVPAQAFEGMATMM